MFNSLSPHDAIKHHFSSLKTDLIFLQLGVLEWQFPWNWLTNTLQFSLISHPLQIIFIHYECDSNSRLVVNEDDNGKFKIERVKHQDLQMFGDKLIWVIFTRLKVWVAVARHNFKWVNILIILFSGLKS